MYCSGITICLVVVYTLSVKRPECDPFLVIIVVGSGIPLN